MPSHKTDQPNKLLVYVMTTYFIHLLFTTAHIFNKSVKNSIVCLFGFSPISGAPVKNQIMKCKFITLYQQDPVRH